MKLTLVLTLLCTLQSYAGLNGQTVTVTARQKEIGKVLKMIEQQGDFRFLFNSQLKDIKQKVSISATDADINTVLVDLFNGTNLTYKKITGNLYAIRSNDPAELQDIRITGRVTGENGEALSGASILIKGTSKGVTTDNNGNFSLDVPENATLVVSAIGYESQEVKVGTQTVLDIKLVQATRKMEEVVVIGYGTASKRDLTGSITKVAGKEVADKPNTNPVASLQAKVAGLSVVNNGTPGSEPDVRIRGTISIGSVKPLYVVDGIFSDNISFVNPNDIESIEVLKDPSSLAIFGVLGAPGVIAVTTKRAKAGQILVNFNTSFGTKQITDRIEMANAEEFKLLLAEEGQNRFDATGATAINDFIATQMPKWTGNTDWVDAMTQTANFSATNLSVTASTDKNKFYMGFGYTSDEGVVKHSKYERLNLTLNDEFKVTRGIKLGFSVIGSKEKFPYGGASGQLAQAKRVAPIVPSGTINIYNKNPYGSDSANYDLYYGVPIIQNTLNNPLNELENNWDKTINEKYRVVGSVFAEINFLQNFTFRGTLYGDIGNQDIRTYYPLYDGYNPEISAPYNVSILTSVNQEKIQSQRFQQDYILTYKKNFNEHHVTATAGFTTNYTYFTGLYGTVKQKAGTDPIPDDNRFWYVSNGFGDVSSQRSSSYQKEASTVSVLGRVLYNYANKYYLNLSVRNDASSLIYNPDTRAQTFWAVGAAWEMTREDFMNNQQIFDFLKIKASMGVLGNQNTYGTDYPYFPSISAGNTAVFGNSVFPSFSNNYIVSKDLKWETVKGMEFGFEFAAFKNRLHGEFAYYDKKTSDMWAYLRPPGVLPTLGNLGAVTNKGIEFSASWDQKINDDWSFTVGGNITTYDNNVTKLDYPLPADEQFPNQTQVGYPIGYFYGYEVAGVIQSYADKLGSPVFTDFSYGPGDLKYKDQNGDGKIDGSDKTMIGNPTPDFAYGGSINVVYKNFNLGIDVGGVYGNEIYRYWNTSENVFSVYNYPKYALDRWHGEGTSNWVPILDQTRKVNRVASSYGIDDGSYFRIRNLQVGYNVDAKFVKKIYARNARVYFNIQNLKTWQNNLGYSPEFGGGFINGQPATSFGIDIGDANSAIPRVFTFGLNVTF